METHSELTSVTLGLVGIVWDSINWSCAYDSLFIILYYIWTNNPHKWNEVFTELNPTTALFAKSYQKVYNKTHMGEYAQDIVRAKLHDDAPHKFPNGHRGTVLAEVVHDMLGLTQGTWMWAKCLSCEVPTVSSGPGDMHIIEHFDREATSITDIIHSGIKAQQIL